MSTDDPSSIPLGELILEITKQLRAAEYKEPEGNPDDRPVMQFESCEIELAISAEREASGGIQVWALRLGGGVKKSEVNTIKIRMTAIDGNASIFLNTTEEDGPNLG